MSHLHLYPTCQLHFLAENRGEQFSYRHQAESYLVFSCSPSNYLLQFWNSISLRRRKKEKKRLCKNQEQFARKILESEMLGDHPQGSIDSQSNMRLIQSSPITSYQTHMLFHKLNMIHLTTNLTFSPTRSIGRLVWNVTWYDFMSPHL